MCACVCLAMNVVRIQCNYTQNNVKLNHEYAGFYVEPAEYLQLEQK